MFIRLIVDCTVRVSPLLVEASSYNPNIQPRNRDPLAFSKTQTLVSRLPICLRAVVYYTFSDLIKLRSFVLQIPFIASSSNVCRISFSRTVIISSAYIQYTVTLIRLRTPNQTAKASRTSYVPFTTIKYTLLDSRGGKQVCLGSTPELQPMSVETQSPSLSSSIIKIVLSHGLTSLRAKDDVPTRGIRHSAIPCLDLLQCMQINPQDITASPQNTWYSGTATYEKV
jgi:hypothetical protein